MSKLKQVPTQVTPQEALQAYEDGEKVFFGAGRDFLPVTSEEGIVDLIKQGEELYIMINTLVGYEPTMTYMASRSWPELPERVSKETPTEVVEAQVLLSIASEIERSGAEYVHIVQGEEGINFHGFQLEEPV